ncbi:ADP-ribosylation/Crystallin J1 [Coprinopsis marcescibilis]|uniref:ADP-ribosylhydrolase ARH3 n=1 Tax=Coprinopsis marcescibilis TaxID=230819 RepID=A0A5C3LCE4_COPMA|nr:ADP-ribosylation/Crystallin J1 [Coprinopsis marcescibilis]
MSLKFWKSNEPEAATEEPHQSPPQSTSAAPSPTTFGYANVNLEDQPLVDALGGPPEFKKRFSFPLVNEYIPNNNFQLPPGVWTDDTSMTLCLARSIAQYGFNEARQLEAYNNWFRNGELSAVGHCFDIGGTTRAALRYYADSKDASEALKRIQETLSGDNSAGNGSLMRVIPIGIAFWRKPKIAMKYARRSSATTHPTPLCQEACEFWTAAVTEVMKAATSQSVYSKLDLLRYISGYSFQDHRLKAALTLPSDAPALPKKQKHSDSDIQELYQKYHPVMRLIQATRDNPDATQTGGLKLPTAKDLPSTGFVFHSLVAALYCFFATDTFEAGAVMVVNLGSDADTVGAIYGGLAGCWYSSNDSLDESAPDTLFWTQRVRAWKAGLVQRKVVETVAEELAQFEKDWERS